MNKAVILTFLLFIGVLIGGKIHWNDTIENAYHSAYAQNKELKMQEAKKVEAAKQTWLGKLDPKVVVMTSSAAQETRDKSWARLLEQEFLKTNKDVNFSTLNTAGYSTADMIEKGVLDKALSSSPDVMILETGLLNDFADTRVSTVNEHMGEIMNKIAEKSPQTRVVFMPPNQPENLDDQFNFLGLNFRQYEQQVKESIKSQGWTYVDYWESFEESYEGDGLELADLLEEGTSLNDQGHTYVMEAIKPFFMK